MGFGDGGGSVGDESSSVTCSCNSSQRFSPYDRNQYAASPVFNQKSLPWILILLIGLSKFAFALKEGDDLLFRGVAQPG